MNTWLIIFFFILSVPVFAQITVDRAVAPSDGSKSDKSVMIMKESYLPYQSIMFVQQKRDRSDPKFDPFFCRIEDAISKTSKVLFKFRLGSVQYVDALEGKSYWEAVSYSKATNQHLSLSQKRH
ncbi:MAG: hypothetical protein OEQ53_05285 [Saprospiraceae bacterium]|nr:hypothetical protein [Saprospiraceae bacterium]